MRIIAGRLRGRAFHSLRSRALRPSPARLRETLFNLVGPAAEGSRVLDLCAGSGGVGLEALSRGAAAVVFVDDHPSAARLIARNLAALGDPPGVRVVRADALAALEGFARRGARFGLVFIDPPYGTGVAAGCLRSAALHAIIEKGARGRVFLQHRRGERPESAPGWKLLDERSFGDTLLSTYGEEDET